MFALITANPKTILQVFQDTPSSIRLPSGDDVYGAQVGWSGEGCTLVAVAPFAVPSGRQIMGGPSYSFDASGSVVESYATEAIPAPPPPPPPSVSALAFRQLFTSAERLAITTAAMSNAQIRMFMDDASAAGNIVLTDPQVAGGLAALVSAGLLTQDRANQITAGTAPN